MMHGDAGKVIGAFPIRATLVDIGGQAEGGLIDAMV